MGFRGPAASSTPRVTARPSGDWKRTSRSASEPNQLRPSFVVLANSKSFAFDARTVVSTDFQVAFVPEPDRYDSGTAESSASMRPSDNCQNRAFAVRLPVSSLTRLAFGSLLGQEAFSRSAIPNSSWDGGLSSSLPSSANQLLTVSTIPLPSPSPAGAA